MLYYYKIFNHKQKNNQESLIVDKNDLHDNTLKKIYYYLFNLNLSELDIIKQKSLNMINKLNKKEEAENEKKNKEKFLELDNYEINGNNEKGHFKKNKNIIYPERKPHYDSIINRYNKSENDNNNENDKDNSVNYFSDEDEFLLMGGLYLSKMIKIYLEIPNSFISFLDKYPLLQEIHGFYLDFDRKLVSFDIIVDFKDADAEKIKNEMLEDLKVKFPNYNYYIVIDIDFAD